MKIALDTNILIYFLEGAEPYATKAEKILSSFMRGENQGIVSTISIAEVLTGFYTAKDEKRTAKAKNLLQGFAHDGFKIVPVSFEITDSAACLRAKRGGRLPDAIIAATAIDEEASLIYSQDDDFQLFSKDIKVSKLE